MPVCLALLEGRPRILVNRVEQTSLAFDPISSATWHSAGVGAPTDMRLLLLPLLLLPCTKADSINQGKGKVLEGRKVRLNNRLLKMRHPAADSKERAFKQTSDSTCSECSGIIEETLRFQVTGVRNFFRQYSRIKSRLRLAGGKWNKLNFSVETTKTLASMIYGSKWNSSSKVQNETGAALCHGVYASEMACDTKVSACRKQQYDAALAKEVKRE